MQAPSLAGGEGARAGNGAGVFEACEGLQNVTN